MRSARPRAVDFLVRTGSQARRPESIVGGMVSIHMRADIPDRRMTSDDRSAPHAATAQHICAAVGYRPDPGSRTLTRPRRRMRWSFDINLTSKVFRKNPVLRFAVCTVIRRRAAPALARVTGDRKADNLGLRVLTAAAYPSLQWSGGMAERLIQTADIAVAVILHQRPRAKRVSFVMQNTRRMGVQHLVAFTFQDGSRIWVFSTASDAAAAR